MKYILSFFKLNKFSNVEEKIFFQILVLTLIVVAISIPINIFAGFIIIIYVAIGVLFFYLTLLYLHTYKKRFKFSVLMYATSVFIFLTFFWFFNAGLEGRIGVFFVSLSMITPIITPRKYQIVAIVVISVTLAALSCIDYFYENLISKYQNRESKYVDITITYITQAVFIFLIVRFLKDNYDKNKQDILIKDFEIVKQNKMLIQRSIELEEKNKLLQEMLENNKQLFSIISHDLRSPITSSKALIELAYKGEIDAEQLREAIPDMYKNFRFTLSLVDNLLFWAKSQFEEFKLNRRTFNLNEFLYSLTEGFGLLAEYKRIKLEIDIPQKPVFINFDREILEIVIRNVFSNAVKFSHFEGVVGISCLRKNGFLYIFVIDNGVGITPEDLEKIKRGILFSHKGTDYEKGTGLGLSLCQNLLRKCDASLETESTFGKGTGVSIKIPVKYVVEAKEVFASTQNLPTD